MQRFKYTAAMTPFKKNEININMAKSKRTVSKYTRNYADFT